MNRYLVEQGGRLGSCRPGCCRRWCGTHTLASPVCTWCLLAPDPLIPAAIWSCLSRSTHGKPPPTTCNQFKPPLPPSNTFFRLKHSFDVGYTVSVLSKTWLGPDLKFRDMYTYTTCHWLSVYQRRIYQCCMLWCAFWKISGLTFTRTLRSHR